MKRVFISQPMRGLTSEEIIVTREKAAEEARRLLGKDIVILDSYFNTVPNNCNVSLWCLGRSVMLMSAADVVYFTPGWQDYRGCRIENACAEEYGLDIIYG
jgi:hypothetical protein